MKLTIGMAHYDDFEGAYFTVQHIRQSLWEQDPELLSNIEWVIIDNNPGSKQGKRLAKWLRKVPNSKYVPFGENVGTAAAKNQVFNHATGEVVLVVDCHITVSIRGLREMVQYFKDNPNTKDLIQGPLQMDSLDNFETHFQPIWSGKMFGVWGRARISPKGTLYNIITTKDGMKVYGLFDNPNTQPAWSQIDDTMLSGLSSLKTLQDLGHRYADEVLSVFEIPSQGMGLFACRRDAWVGFNPHFKGFGGEEGYIHEKFRQAGAKALCLSSLKWLHRFRDTDPETAEPLPFPNTTFDRVRNYIIGWNELKLSVMPIFQHFVNEQQFSPDMWNRLITDPIHADFEEVVQKQIGNARVMKLPQPPVGISIPDLVEWARRKPRDLNTHFTQMVELASDCETITEFTARRESTFCWAAGLEKAENPKKLTSFSTELDPGINAVYKAPRSWELVMNFASTENYPSGVPTEQEIEETDLLFIQGEPSGSFVEEALSKFSSKVNKYIVIANTKLHGESGPKVGKVMLPGIRIGVEAFLKKNPEWFIYKNDPNQNGLTVLSKISELRPAEPIRPWTPGYGPGTRLKQFLKKFGIEATANCSCNQRAITMDKNGATWCRENRALIIEWMREEAKKRKMQALFVPYVVGIMIDRSINLGEKDQLEKEKDYYVHVKR